MKASEAFHLLRALRTRTKNDRVNRLMSSDHQDLNCVAGELEHCLLELLKVVDQEIILSPQAQAAIDALNKEERPDPPDKPREEGGEKPTSPGNL